MLKNVQAALATMLTPGESLLAGVSGGPDSVALLDALVALGYRPHVCHLNHQWRGKQSDADAEFVGKLAGKYGLPVTIGSRRVPHNEDAARQARLKFFERVARKTGIHTVALAHTADDQVETFLMRLIRGAGATGLAGMAPDRKIGALRVVRPLLDVSRQEVLKYLSAHRLKYREDASNRDRRFLRNRVRHELLPLLEKNYNPAIRDVVLRTAEILRAEAAKAPAAWERREIRRQLGALSFRQVEEVRKRLKGKWPVRVQGRTVIRELGIQIVCHSERSEESRSSGKTTKTHRFAQGDKPCERFDADAIGEAPFVRTWRAGDRFQPLGMTGKKKLQDFFVDEKVPRRQRSRVPLLCASDGRIAWVAGYRIAEPFKVRAQTRRVLRVRAEAMV
jgi:tRNA(Ile)-lysidine synthase